VKWATFPQSVNEVHRLLSINLAWYLCNELLDIEDHLKDLNICLPVTKVNQRIQENIEETDSTLVVISNNLFPCSIPLPKL